MSYAIYNILLIIKMPLLNVEFLLFQATAATTSPQQVTRYPTLESLKKYSTYKKL